MEDRAPDTELHLEHTTDSPGCDKSGSEEATDTEDSSGGEELVESSVHHQGGEEQSGVQSGSDTGRRGKRHVKRKIYTVKQTVKVVTGREEEEGREGVSRCRISRRRTLLQRRMSLLQRRLLKSAGSI